MLTYQTIGPNGAGKYLVTYPTPGCNVPTVACECSTAEQAAGEVGRLNAVQAAWEQTVQHERKAAAAKSHSRAGRLI
jgi:hypothetical protein